jgi:D,D-heptose 1,7-bisphosphate phosphatase
VVTAQGFQIFAATMLTTAAILAGGRGTRLGDATKTVPKSMVPVLGEPLLQHLMRGMAQQGIQTCYLLTGHLGQVIEDHFGAQFMGMRLHYIQETTALGTAGALAQLQGMLQEPVLVAYGDVMMSVDLQRLYAFHHNKGAQLTLVAHPNDHPGDSDLIVADDLDRVTAVLPKPHPTDLTFRNLVNAALYVVNPEVVNLLEAGKNLDLGRDVFPHLVLQVATYAYRTAEYLKDMGTPERLRKVEHAMASGLVEARNMKNPQKAFFLDRDGVLNEDTDLISRKEDFHLYPYTARCLKQMAQAGYLTVVTTNQSVVARGKLSLEGLDELHRYMDMQLAENGAWVDHLYFCPHHPHGGFPGEVAAFKRDCDCRKPKPGMILQGVAHYNIHPALSFMVGDSARDMEAGSSAGCTTVGVMTGHALKNCTVRPDFVFENLEEATQFLLYPPYEGLWSEVRHQVPQFARQPLVVLIGGNTRSGKSTLAAWLAMKARQEGIPAMHIRLDDWILPAEHRQEEGHVLATFQWPKVEDDVLAILRGETVALDPYNSHPSWNLGRVTYHRSGERLIVIEGVVALALTRVMEKVQLRYHKSIGPEELHRAFTRFYTWKGKSPDEITTLFAQRQREYQLVEALASNAQRRIP